VSGAAVGLLQERGERGAEGLAGDLVAEVNACQVDGAEDAAAPVVPGVMTCWRVPGVIRM
jgi:hypothetical protein